MKTNWDLTDLYESFESDLFIDDLKLLQEKIHVLNTFVSEDLEKTDPEEGIYQYIQIDEFITTKVTRLMAYCRLTQSVDATHVKAQAYLDQIRAMLIAITKPSTIFVRFLKKLENLELLIDNSERLLPFKFYLMSKLDASKYLLDDDTEELIVKMKATGSTAFSDLQNLVSSTLMIDVDGHMMPLPALRNMAYSSDASARKRGYEVELDAYKQIEHVSAACLNGIKGEVITTSKLRGYESVLDETIIKSRVKKETIDAMFTAMKESLPKFHEYYKAKAEYLGYLDGLPFYELFAPVGQSELTYTFEEAHRFITDTFKTFSDELSDFVDHAFKNQWIDALPKEGKRGGAFCSNLHPIKQSRILANFDGSFSNTKTIAHELGHAYHGHCLQEENILNSSYTMPIAETASIFCETLLKQKAIEQSSKSDAFTILEVDLQGSGQVIVDIYSRFLFEQEVFKIRENKNLSVNEFKDLMLKAQKDAYGDSLDHQYLHPYMWINKSHYYSAALNYYNFPYAFGLLFAKGVYAKYLEDKESFPQRYKQMLSATGKNQIEDVAMILGIDVTSVDFWRQSLNTIAKDIDLFVQLSKEV